MATVYRPYVGRTVTHEGVTFTIDEGEEVDFSGKTMVRNCIDVYDDRSKWFSTEHEARLAASAEILSIADRLRKQAESLA